ncbi:MAG: glutamate--tRNA ligase [Rhizobiaceae bacterium]|nr:glutamate--tRNA ligase [Rhizobiaceae bacterium]
MTVRVRFAPSPTGNIHIGNARPALINWLFALQNKGEFVLRFDDTDKERSKQEYADGIARDLDWLGIKPHIVERQSDRAEQHQAATQNLKDAGLLYPCYETPDQLDRQRKRLAARGKPPIYDRSALRLDDEQRKELESEGLKPHWRFLLPNYKDDPFVTERTEVKWQDEIRGEQTVDLASMSDPVLIRADGSWLYTLPSVVDDIDLGITHIIRGDDHVTNTGAQIAIFRALGAEPPTFGHHNLLTTESGEGLSKRLGSLSIHTLAEDGYEAMAVACLAVLTGTSGPVEALANMDALVQTFDPKSVTKSSAKFDPSELGSLNRRIVHQLDYSDVSDRLEAAGVSGGEDYWNAVRGNLEKVSDASDLWQIVENASPVINDEDREFIDVALRCIPEGEFTLETWGEWIGKIKQESDRKGKDLFMPLRKALTGMEHGPELDKMLPLIGRERTLVRLS